jgi:TRAP-type mannitol/chloroaromatic compound transport system permease small subunit
VDVLLERWGPRARLWIDLVGGMGLLIPFCVFAIWNSYEFVADSVATLEQSPDPGGLPRWPIKLLVPLAFGLLLLQAVAEVLRRLAVLAGAPLEETLALHADDREEAA